MLIVEGQSTTRDLRSLFSFLEAHGQFDGLLELRSLGPDDHLGALTDAIVVAVGSGGAISMVVAVVGSWLQRRTSTIKVSFTNDQTGQSLELSGTRIREASTEDLQAILRDLGELLAVDHDEGHSD
ncbi:hypothetical protein K1W54_29300 [Micromonospora sp. CPCC 205371]|nr:hypothetical protein [Micromonospora sp. CPCC 205371]